MLLESPLFPKCEKSNMTALRLRGVTKRYGKFVAVDNIDLDIPRQSIYGFLGPNGAGKTTTIRMIMSILYPDEGDIEVLGESNAEAVKDRLGYLPEEKGLYKKMTAGEILVYFGRLKGMDAKTAVAKATELLDRYGLGQHYHTKCEALSKGMGQKVQILGTIIHGPEMVILDEPFSGLDPVNIELMRDLILDMRKSGITVIFSTHIMQQAEELCDSIVLINKGKKILDGTVPEVRGSHDKGIVLEYEGDSDVVRSAPGIARVNDTGKRAEIFMEPDVDSQSLLEYLVPRVKIRRFDISEPSLHEVFFRAVGGQSDE